MTRRAVRAVSLALLCSLGAACGPDYGDLVDALATGDRDAGRELLLAKGEAVAPLLEAFDDPERAEARPHLVPVLFSLRQRLAAPSIAEALVRHLRTDPDPRVRALIAEGAGTASGVGGVEDLLGAAADTDSAVRRAALKSLTTREDEVEPEQRLRLESLLPDLLRDADAGVRAEALLWAEGRVRQLVAAADRQLAQADLAAAESLYTAARDFSPDSWMAKFRQARFYYDQGDRRGLELMRSHGMVLDVPRTAGRPRLDGVPDEPFWQDAARAPLGYKTNYFTAAPADLQTDLYIAAAEDALYIGVRSVDGHTDSLVAHRTARDDQIWLEDSIELFFDANLDRRSYVQFILSSLGTVFDAVHEDGIRTQQREWTAVDSLVTHVGEGFWSLEYRVEYDERWMPRPEPGAVWGTNFVRDYRDLVNYSQWVYTYRTVHQPDVFGLLVFE